MFPFRCTASYAWTCTIYCAEHSVCVGYKVCCCPCGNNAKNVGVLVCTGVTQDADNYSLQLQEAEGDAGFEESAADSSTYEAEEEPTYEGNEDAEADSGALQGSGDDAVVPNRAHVHAAVPFKALKGTHTTGGSMLWHRTSYATTAVANTVYPAASMCLSQTGRDYNIHDNAA